MPAGGCWHPEGGRPLVMPRLPGCRPAPWRLRLCVLRVGGRDCVDLIHYRLGIRVWAL